MSSVNSKTYWHISPNGSSIFVEKYGSGPLMVLMHGLGGSTNVFQPLITPFASSFTMLRFDFPGSGLSTFKTVPSIPSFVSDLSSILAAHQSEGQEAPILVGHSLGSIVAMHYAAQNPNAVKALVLIGPGRSASHIPAVVDHMNGLGMLAREGIERIRDSTIANNVAPSSSDLVRTVVRQMISAQDSEGYASTCEAICAKSHIDPDYAVIQCPTLFIAGDQDKISTLERSEGLRTLIGTASERKLLAVVHSGHQQVLEDTEGVVKAMNSLLSLI